MPFDGECLTKKCLTMFDNTQCSNARSLNSWRKHSIFVKNQMNFINSKCQRLTWPPIYTAYICWRRSLWMLSPGKCVQYYILSRWYWSIATEYFSRWENWIDKIPTGFRTVTETRNILHELVSCFIDNSNGSISLELTGQMAERKTKQTRPKRINVVIKIGRRKSLIELLWAHASIHT